MDKITIDRIKTAHPSIREMLLRQYQEINSLLPKDVRLRFAYVYRSIAEQDALFNQRPKVTNAKGGQSIHNYGLAFDIVLLYDKDGNETFETASWEQNSHWMQVVNYFKSKGWEWGGDWAKFKDAPHFQLKKKDGSSYKWQELTKMHTIIDNGIKYPKL
jgi:peptidoglycan L-alanyl-D-glutamate endopeptidase CwlK